jgi:hypothetical protein
MGADDKRGEIVVVRHGLRLNKVAVSDDRYVMPMGATRCAPL